MLEEEPDEHLVRIVQAAIDRGIERMRHLNLSPEALAHVESQMRRALEDAARGLRRDLNGGHEH